MAEIKERNKCENCIHNNVCEFRTGREECLKQMNNKLDNPGYMTDFFVLSFECKEFIKREPTGKDDLRNALHNCGWGYISPP